jgi:hypothetical protein
LRCIGCNYFLLSISMMATPIMMSITMMPIPKAVTYVSVFDAGGGVGVAVGCASVRVKDDSAYDGQ